MIDLSWAETTALIAEQAQLMNIIHEKYPGKENSTLRDRLCKPHRDICIALHYRRIELLQATYQKTVVASRPQLYPKL